MYEIRLSEHPHGGEYYEPQNNRPLSNAAAADLARLAAAVHEQLCGDPPKPSRHTTGIAVACPFWGSGSVMARANGDWHYVEFRAEDFPVLADALKFEYPEDPEDREDTALRGGGA